MDAVMKALDGKKSYLGLLLYLLVDLNATGGVDGAAKFIELSANATSYLTTFAELMGGGGLIHKLSKMTS